MVEKPEIDTINADDHDDDGGDGQQQRQQVEAHASIESLSASTPAGELAAAIDSASRATDQPAPTADGKLDEIAVKLPHLLSPFDVEYPQSKGGDRWKALTDDGHVMICTLEENEEGKQQGNVPILTRVYVNVEGRLEDGTRFLDYPTEELDFTLGQAQVPKGLEMSVCQMHVGQHALIRCSSDYGFSPTRRPPHVPTDAMLFMRVNILRYEKEKNLHEMSMEDKYRYIEKRRAVGKELYGTGVKHRSAIKQYEKAITVLESIRNHEVDSQTVETKNDLLALFWLNQAQCYMKLHEYDSVMERCNKALQLRPNHLKCLVRRAEAHRARQEWREAMRDYQKVIDTHQRMEERMKNEGRQQEEEGMTEVGTHPQTTNSTSTTTTTAPTPLLPPSASSILSPIPSYSAIDPSVLSVCRSYLHSLSTRIQSDDRSQRRRLDGFMKRSKDGGHVLLYDDKADDEDKTRAGKGENEQEDDYSWLNPHTSTTTSASAAASIWTMVTSAASSIAHFFRSWCNTHPRLATTHQTHQSDKKTQ